ncbi:hypothetical protein SAMN02745116_01536 [Pilibacter termitis]|uniref:Uncharacterized protein n=1 Tax=Pilibacter termitis TaxID=263852 RepID=A0A1T4NSS5_9ENTE|nr:hypothetical protein [Pilibacter termitis]SJZ82116.1 hypothetical protein SAMN02745116_01536 [Pilibacter termitis]
MNKQLSKKIRQLYEENGQQHFVENVEKRGKWLMIFLSSLISLMILGALLYALILSLG